MAVKVKVVPQFSLKNPENEPLLLELPKIKVAADGDNIPHISRMICSVSGTPPELATQIQKAYTPYIYQQLQPLTSTWELKANPCQLNQPLTQPVNCNLQVKVDYFDSDAQGNPIQSVPKNIKADCQLSFSSSEKNQSQTGNEKNQPQKRFPGWLALDFGTSNSTVTLFDPIEVPIAEILPKEQERRLRQLLASWLSSPATVALPDVSASEWEKFIHDISRTLEIEPSRLHEIFTGENQQRFLEAIRQIELCLVNSEKFRRAVSKKLYQIYHEVFRVPTLESQNLIPVILDINRLGTEIPSELEIHSLNPLQVKMGEQARKNREKAIAQGEVSSLEKIKSKFHHSPKRYFGQKREFSVSIDGKQDQNITVDQMIQAAWGHLVDLTQDYRQRGKRKFSEGDFRTAVVTYPAVAPPIVRKQVKELVEQIPGIEDVQTAYDEAVSVAIFFLWREFGGNLNIGIESFKTRCRPRDQTWSQNVLVLDIGGGTTDIALIKLTLEDKTPSFANAQDRGLGGRYYKLTPKLLGSSGHLQLGGELVTLRIFRLLKVAIADCLLTAVINGDLESDKLEDLLSGGLSDRFLEKGKFQGGSLLQCLDKENPESDIVAYKEALDTAEKVLPTRWAQAPQRIQTFYTVWDYAEAAKLKLGQKPPKGNSTDNSTASSAFNFTLAEQEITELLNQCAVKFQSKNPSSLSITLDKQQFERAATSAIKEAIGIAKGLMESRLGSTNTQKDNDDQLEKVDWLILSGKTCNLHLVEREIYQEFSQSKYFVWNQERITFVLEFTKLATSAGACYAEKLRRLRFDPEKSKELLRQGANQLEIDVKNLSYYLPCNFQRKTLSQKLLPIFKAGQELYQIFPQDTVAKIRTQWLGIQLSNIIYRQDYDRGDVRLWGNFDGNKLWQELQKSDPKLNESTFLEQIKIQFEIDSALQINVLLCRGNPYYLLNGSGIDVGEAIKKADLNPEQTALFNNDGKLQWNIFTEKTEKGLNNGDIAVNVLESTTVDRPNAYHPVFKVDNSNAQPLQEFYYGSDNKQQGVGLISDPLPPFPQSNQHTFYIYHTDENNSKKWIRIGELKKPDVVTDYPCQYRVTLDDKGMLRMHPGEVPYWESSDQKCLHQTGCVFRTELELQPNEVEAERDPFSGIH